MASHKRTSSCSFFILLLIFLNFILFLLSAASLAPTLTLRPHPTPLGFAFLFISAISLISALLGFYSHLTHFCYIFHISFLLVSTAAQLLGFLALFIKENSSLLKLRSERDPREAKLLVRVECGVLMAMVVTQLVILVVRCGVEMCWVKEYEGLEAEREAGNEKRRKRMARVQEESMARVTEMKIGDEKMKKNDFEA